MGDPKKDEPKEAIDPELVGLRRRRRVGPLLALAVLAMATYLMMTLRADLLYALADEQPVDLGEAAGLWRDDRLAVPDNVYAQVRAVPDGTSPARLSGRQDTGFRMVPAAGTHRHLWLQLEGEAANVAPRYDLVFTGRLRAIADLPFANELRDYVEGLPPLPRFFFPEQMAAGKPSRDVAGDRLSPPGDARVVLEERVAGTSRVTVIATEERGTEASIRQQLVETGVLPAPQPPVEASDQVFVYEVPGEPAEVKQKIRAARLYAASAVAKVQRIEGTWDDLAVEAGTARLGGRAVALGQIERASVEIEPDLPADARILLEEEPPERYWYMAPLYGLLVFFSLLMAWALVRAFRDRPAAVRPALKLAE